MNLKNKIKELHKLKTVILVIFLLFIFMFIFISIRYFESSKTENAMSSDIIGNNPISNAEKIDIEKYIKVNNYKDIKEETVVEDIELEYITKYKNNSELPRNIVQVVQEGRAGVQRVTTKKIYDLNGKLIEEVRLSTSIVKSSIDKIVEVGTANYTSNYTVKVKDNIYSTTDRLSVMLENSVSSQKISTLPRDTKMTVKEINGDWYKISTDSGVNRLGKSRVNNIYKSKFYIYR